MKSVSDMRTKRYKYNLHLPLGYGDEKSSNRGILIKIKGAK